MVKNKCKKNNYNRFIKIYKKFRRKLKIMNSFDLVLLHNWKFNKNKFKNQEKFNLILDFKEGLIKIWILIYKFFNYL